MIMKMKKIFIIIKKIVYLTCLFLFILMILNMFKLEILNNILENQKEYLYLLVNIFLNFLMLILLFFIDYLRGIFPVLSSFIEFIHLFLNDFF